MDNSIQIPLDLPDVRVLKVSNTEEGSWLIRVESTIKGTSCRKCGKELTHFHGFDQPIRLRHLPIFEQPVCKDYVVLITTPLGDRGVEILAVLPDRKKETVVKFFASIPIHLRNTIRRVCTDMYLGFVNAAREELPRAHIIIDRFHVARAYRNCVDRVRKVELKLLKQNLSKKEYARLKGAMWA